MWPQICLVSAAEVQKFSRMLLMQLGLTLSERRSNIYSDRPNFTMASQVMTRGLFVALGRYHDIV